MIPVRDEDIGGAVVRRRINRGADAPWLGGHRLTRDEVMAMPTANRRALVENESLWLAPKSELAALENNSNAARPKLGLPKK